MKARHRGPVLLLLGLGLLLAGVIRGEAFWVLRYALTLCLACMGLGG